MQYPEAKEPPGIHAGLLWIVAVLSACVLGLFVLPSPWCGASSRQMARRTNCAANLKAIATACLVYAEANQGRFPPSLDVLIQGGSKAYLQSKQVICPISHEPYAYISGQRNSDDPHNVVVYDSSIHNHGGEGGCLGYLDGHAIWHQPSGFKNEIDATMRRLTTPRTQPQGL